jgi:hypothetical protein
MAEKKYPENTETKPIQKPVTMIMTETQVALSDVINNSGLPIYIVEPMIRELANECRKLLEIYSNQEMELYIRSTQKENRNETDKRSC